MDIDSGNIFPRTKIGRDHQMRDMFRHGKVIERKMDPKLGPLVRVQYLDKQGLISKFIPIKQPGSRLTMHFYCPKIGDDVNVTMLPNGSEDGFVDGSFFNEANPPPEVDLDTRHFKTEDGSIIEYRENDSTFNLDASGASGGTLRAGGGGVVTVKANEITLEGHMIFKGDIDHTGNMTTSGAHTDANGVHMGGKEIEIEERLHRLEEKVALLERQWHSLEHLAH